MTTEADKKLAYDKLLDGLRVKRLCCSTVPMARNKMMWLSRQIQLTMTLFMLFLSPNYMYDHTTGKENNGKLTPHDAHVTHVMHNG